MHFKETKGFTLIEVLLASSITIFFILAVMGFLQESLAIEKKSQIVKDVHTQALYIENYLRESVSNASGVTLPLAGNSGNSLTLVFTDVSRNPTVFQLTTSELTVTEGLLSSPVVLHNNTVTIDSFTATHYQTVDGFSLVSFEYTISSDTDSPLEVFNYSQDYKTSANVLNYGT